MLIKSVDLTNFRSHQGYHLDCQPDTTLILGPNGCGKTSVLEAIYILLKGKSFRATDPDIIKRDTPFYRISLSLDTGETRVATYDGTKIFQIADKKFYRLPPKYQYPIILFEPADLNLITGSPTRHREYFDRIFSQLSSDYASALNKYQKTIRQRNILLKSPNFTPSQTFSWDLLLAQFGTELTKYRAAFVAEINQTLNQVYHSIAPNSDTISINYVAEAGGLTSDKYIYLLESSLEKDRILGRTTFGVHHDNLKFIFNHQNANGSASRGESRSIILALKFIEANLIFQKFHIKPLILLDDVFSELDQTRRQCLIDNFKNHQVIITSVEALNNPA